MIFSRAFTIAVALSFAPSLVSAARPTEPGFDFLNAVGTAYSFTAENNLRGGLGELTVQRFEFEANGSTIAASGATFLHGLGLVRTELDRPATSLLPETLQELSVRLGWLYQHGEHWRFSVAVRPGFFGDDDSPEGDTFNVPMLALASYAQSRELVWSFGVVANAFNDNPVLPVAGMRWAFAPSWIFNVGLPRTGVAWEINPSTTLMAGATLQGGAYRLTRQPTGAPAGAPALHGAELDYREIRVGIGLAFKLSPALSLTIDAGVAIDQRFDYHELGIEQRGSDAAFGAIGFTGRF